MNLPLNLREALLLRWRRADSASGEKHQHCDYEEIELPGLVGNGKVGWEGSP